MFLSCFRSRKIKQQIVNKSTWISRLIFIGINVGKFAVHFANKSIELFFYVKHFQACNDTNCQINIFTNGMISNSHSFGCNQYKGQRFLCRCACVCLFTFQIHILGARSGWQKKVRGEGIEKIEKCFHSLSATLGLGTEI